MEEEREINIHFPATRHSFQKASAAGGEVCTWDCGAAKFAGQSVGSPAGTKGVLRNTGMSVSPPRLSGRELVVAALEPLWALILCLLPATRWGNVW